MEVKLNGLCVVFLILTILMSIATVCYKPWEMRSRSGGSREKKVEVFSGDEEGVLQCVEKKGWVTSLSRGEGFQCPRTCQGPESMLLYRSGLPMASSVSGFGN